ncbi:hypothetical protein [Clostridium algidicarnis]|uniref:hypothetical protein n=1 Tax=Clostridium algidicarnis TaxID=37659 RepID=UPI0016242751|nr:hypothetical protein [Clostridium algidicarnis]MBB6631860.1 hypothetical protein [Clostridium algidicarnis]MBU3192487.1 hypothetical protein [Clostridium algidicarnis]
MKLSVEEKDSKGIEEIESFNRVTKGETIEPAVLSAKYLNSVRGHIQGIDIPLFNGVLQSMHIVPLPEEEFNCDIVSIKSNKKITGNFKRYILKDRIIIVLETSFVILSWTFNLVNGYKLVSNESEFNLSIKRSNGNYEDETKEIKIIIDWLTGKVVRVYRQDNYKCNFSLPKGKGKDVNNFVNDLKIRNRIFENIVNVRRYFGVNLKDITSINTDEAKLLENLNEIGKNGKLKLESISLKVSDLLISEEASYEMFIKDSTFLLESGDTDNIEVNLFGEKIMLGKHKIKCRDAYISNYDEVKNKIADKLIIKSKRNKLFIEYCLA